MKIQDDFTIKTTWRFTQAERYFFAFISLFAILFLIYSNSFDCSWHFDDYANIIANANIQIEDLSWQNIEKSLYGIIGSNRWQRPVAYFSFVVNYYFGGLDVFGYHLVNLLIHIIAAFFLFLLIYNTLQLPLIRKRYQNHTYSIALLATFLWAINPIQVTAVTYIVQRMASMAGLFYIMTMYFYLKGRTSIEIWRNILFYFLMFLSGILAIGTKENAAMLPVSIFIYDLLLIQGVTIQSIKNSYKYALMAAVTVLIIGFIYNGDVSTLLGDYEFRPFTMFERMMTQPRVLLFYISLLIYPITSRLMLIHDIQISKSLFDPWTTIIALLLIIFTIAFAIMSSRKRPLIAYCIIFFFLNHLIEGSFISLELVYEHRNYVPSLLFFVPIAIAIVKALEAFSTKRLIVYLLTVAVSAILIIQGVTVYIQNKTLQDEITLWRDNAEKAPRLHIVHQNLATAYLIDRRLQEAFTEATLALDSYQAANIHMKCRTHALLGEYYYLSGDDKNALMHYRRTSIIDPAFHTSYRRIADIMIRSNNLQEAEVWIRKALSLKPGSYTYHVIYAGILLKQGYPDAAIKEAGMSLKMNGNQSAPYAIMSDAYLMKNDDRLGAHFKKIAEESRVREKDTLPESFQYQVTS